MCTLRYSSSGPEVKENGCLKMKIEEEILKDIMGKDNV